MQPLKRCAIYTRKSSEEGLEQDFNSLHAQREACEAYIRSQKHEGWQLVPTAYDDGGLSGGTLERPALQRLLADIAAGKVRVVVVYKVDRLTRSLADFAKLVEHFEKYGASFVSITQQFNTTSSMGRLTLNVLLSFAQFEREVTAERIRDKIAASKRKGMFMGGNLPLGYRVEDRKLIVIPAEAERVQHIYERYQQLGCVRRLKDDLDRDGVRSRGDKPFSRGALYTILANPIYIGDIRHKDLRHPGQHKPILDTALWEAVQTQLKAQGTARKGRTGASPSSCLAGKIYDETGDRLTPSHTVKQGRRYRYYVSSRLLSAGNKAKDDGWRLPAGETECAVALATANLLEDRAAILAELNQFTDDASSTAAFLDSAKAIATRLRSDTDRADALQAVVDRIDLQPNSLRVVLSVAALMPPGSVSNREHTITQVVPLKLARRGIGARLIIDGAHDFAAPETSAAFLRLVTRSRDWFESLAVGRVASIAELAKQQDLAERYVSSLLPLAFIAPSIIDAAVENRLPPEFPLGALTDRPDIPVDWRQQQQMFGIAD